MLLRKCVRACKQQAGLVAYALWSSCREGHSRCVADSQQSLNSLFVSTLSSSGGVSLFLQRLFEGLVWWGKMKGCNPRYIILLGSSVPFPYCTYSFLSQFLWVVFHEAFNTSASMLTFPGQYFLSKWKSACCLTQRCPTALSLAVLRTYIKRLLSIKMVKCWA